MPRKLPDGFSSAQQGYSLYKGVEYKEYWNDPGQIRQDVLEKRIISDLLPVSGRRIIDLGCGYGRLAPCYLGRFDQIVLYDGSLSLLQQAHNAVGGRALCVAGDIGNLPFKAASFDNVLIVRVLQHVHALQGAFQEMSRILSKGGRLVFSYHNKRNAHRILQWLRSRKIANPFSLESKEVSPALLSHHPTLIGRLVHNAGFSAPEYQGAVVVDSLAKVTERINRGAPAGLKWARFMGKYKLAPWLVGRAAAEGGDDLRPGSSIADLFECPACRGNHLSQSDQAFECSSCRRSYPIKRGIVDFRP